MNVVIDRQEQCIKQTKPNKMLSSELAGSPCKIQYTKKIPIKKRDENSVNKRTLL